MLRDRLKFMKYIIAFVDSASRICRIYFMETRNADEVTCCFKRFITWMKHQINHCNQSFMTTTLCFP